MLNTLTSPKTHVHAIPLIITIYHYYEVSGEINNISFSLLHSNLLLHILVIIDKKKQSTHSLNYITINLEYFTRHKPTIFEVRHIHIDPILQRFVLLRVVYFIIDTLMTTSMSGTMTLYICQYNATVMMSAKYCICEPLNFHLPNL
jgi:hypothetical protein